MSFVEIDIERKTIVLHENTPELFREKEHTSASLAKAANYYISLGETRAVKKLTALQTDHLDRVEGTSNRALEIAICWVCKLIFEPNPSPLRPAALGSLSLPYDTMPLEKWPNFPLAQENGVYFVLDSSYFLAGVAERSSKYLKYCQANGKFRTRPLPIPTRAKAEQAAEQLFKSKRWSEIIWTYKSPSRSYQLSESWTQSNILKQATSI